MDRIAELLKAGRVYEAMALSVAQEGNTDRSESTSEWHHKRLLSEIESYNARREEPTVGIDCNLCGNKGYTMSYRTNELFGYEETYLIPCKCMESRKSVRRMIASGLQDMIKRYRFDTYKAEEPWQETVLAKARDYVAGNGSLWFFAGGQVGSGKTHICTAICREFLRAGQSVKYMLWRDESAKLKAHAIDEDGTREQMMHQYKTVDVLYIDDLFKTQRPTDGSVAKPTSGDVNVAFEIINARYNDISKKTIISSEWLINELYEIDEGIASRIWERSKGSAIQINDDSRKNWRMRDMGRGLI